MFSSKWGARHLGWTGGRGFARVKLVMLSKSLGRTNPMREKKNGLDDLAKSLLVLLFCGYLKLFGF